MRSGSHRFVPLLLTVMAFGMTTCGFAPKSTDPAIPFTPIDVTTYHYDNARDGLNAHEMVLNLQNVNSQNFGKIAFVSVDGAVDAEPLIAANLLIGGKTHNVLYVATEHDSIYAMDADTGTILWKKSVLGTGEVPSDPHNCGGITPEIGITATPVIDRSQGPNGGIFFVAMTKDASGVYHQRLHALDLISGSEFTDSPTEIAGRFPGTGDNTQGGFVIFDPGQYAARTALLLVNGTIYFGWTSHQDQRPYTGWIMGYSETTLQQTQIINITPNGNAGAIWMSGNGLAADDAGNIYFVDANGTFDTSFDAHGFPLNGDYGNSIIKLSLAAGKVAIADYFTPYNYQALNAADADIGAGGEIILPDMTDSSGKVRHLIAGAGKDENIYLADRDNLGKINAASADNSNLYQEVDAVFKGGIWSSPAYFNGTLYYGSIFDQLKAFQFTDAKLAATPSSASSTVYPYPGSTPAVSANGVSNGIVWAVESSLQQPAVLHAYDASNLAHELYNSNQAASGRDSFGLGNKFITPLVANGKVYIGTGKGLAIFGLFSAT